MRSENKVIIFDWTIYGGNWKRWSWNDWKEDWIECWNCRVLGHLQCLSGCFTIRHHLFSQILPFLDPFFYLDIFIMTSEKQFHIAEWNFGVYWHTFCNSRFLSFFEPSNHVQDTEIACFQRQCWMPREANLCRNQEFHLFQKQSPFAARNDINM